MKPQKVRNRYYLRRHIPDDLRDLYGGRQQVSVPLQTGDLREAQRRIVQEWAKLDREWAHLRGEREPQRGTPEWLQWVADRLRASLKAGEVSPEQAAEEFDHAREEYLRAFPTLGDGSRPDHEEHRGLADDAVERLRALSSSVVDDRITLAEAAELYLRSRRDAGRRESTVSEQGRFLREYMDAVGASTPLVAMTKAKAREYLRTHVLRQPTARATKKKRIEFLSWFYRWAFEVEALQGEAEVINPFTGAMKMVPAEVRGERKKERRWTEEELLTFLTSVPETDKRWHLVVLALYTGARREEVCELTRDHLVLDGAAVQIHDIEGKGKRQASIREVPLHSIIRPFVHHLADTTHDGFLLPGLRRMGQDNRRGKYLGKVTTEKMRALGIPDGKHGGVTFHDLRGTFSGALKDAGVPEALVQDITGHQNAGMAYGLYAGRSPVAVLAECVEKVTFGRVDDVVRAGIFRLTSGAS
ncbi:MAG: DUF6538 domain-containing protein [Pseudomonadales bacterium]|nr:DUF6538 domain-containing protein [Pseudomonadales bacterium]